VVTLLVVHQHPPPPGRRSSAPPPLEFCLPAALSVVLFCTADFPLPEFYFLTSSFSLSSWSPSPFDEHYGCAIEEQVFFTYSLGTFTHLSTLPSRQLFPLQSVFSSVFLFFQLYRSERGSLRHDYAFSPPSIPRTESAPSPPTLC